MGRTSINGNKVDKNIWKTRKRLVPNGFEWRVQ